MKVFPEVFLSILGSFALMGYMYVFMNYKKELLELGIKPLFVYLGFAIGFLFIIIAIWWVGSIVRRTSIMEGLIK
ncbi:MAG: hypothetical protein QXT31_08315 [Candidatus Bathyarchaeia archaeon]